MKRFIIWANSQEMSQGAIADVLDVSKSAVHAFLSKSRADTGELLDAGVVVRVYEPDTDYLEVWMCRFCGDKYDEPAHAALDAYEHMFGSRGLFPNPKYRRVNGVKTVT